MSPSVLDLLWYISPKYLGKYTHTESWHDYPIATDSSKSSELTNGLSYIASYVWLGEPVGKTIATLHKMHSLIPRSDTETGTASLLQSRALFYFETQVATFRGKFSFVIYTAI